MSEATPEVSSEKENQEKKSEQKKTPKKKKPNIKTVDLKIEHFVSSLSQAELNKVIEREVSILKCTRSDTNYHLEFNHSQERMHCTTDEFFSASPHVSTKQDSLKLSLKK